MLQTKMLPLHKYAYNMITRGAISAVYSLTLYKEL